MKLIGLGAHTACSMYPSLYSNILGYSAKSGSSAGPLKVTGPVFFQMANGSYHSEYAASFCRTSGVSEKWRTYALRT
jgi:hypothetical protein